MDKCPVTGQSSMSQEQNQPVKDSANSNVKQSDVNHEIMARKAEIFDIQVGQDTLKVKWDELEKLKAQRLNDLKAILQSNQEDTKTDPKAVAPSQFPGKLPVIEVDEGN